MSRNDRLQKLEAAINPLPCDTSRDWPIFEDILTDYTACGGPPAPARRYPGVCPDCGQQGPGVILLTVVPSREVG
jgi:hypothetical protein